MEVTWKVNNSFDRTCRKDASGRELKLVGELRCLVLFNGLRYLTNRQDLLGLD